MYKQANVNYSDDRMKINFLKSDESGLIFAKREVSSANSGVNGLIICYFRKKFPPMTGIRLQGTGDRCLGVRDSECAKGTISY